MKAKQAKQEDKATTKTGSRPVSTPTGTSDPGAYSAAEREGVRGQLADDVEAFLREGGAIKEVPRNLRADPPRKPESNYGRGSI